MDIQKIIAVLEKAKHEHYIDEGEGLYNCDHHDWPDQPCSCGAAEINAEIDALLVELIKEADEDRQQAIIIAETT